MPAAVMNSTRKPAMLLTRFAVSAVCFCFLLSSSSSSLPSAGAGTGLDSSTIYESSVIRKHRSDVTVSPSGAIEFCYNSEDASDADFTENQTASSLSVSVPAGLLTRGGEQVEQETEDMEDSDESIFEEDDEEEDEDDDDDISDILVDKETKKRKRFLKRRKLKFLNRITEASVNLLKREDASLEKEVSRKRRQAYSGLQYDVSEEDDDRITQQSDITRPGRYVHIVTTAALPWMTGTAVNPLLRAAYLHERLESINRGVSNSIVNCSNNSSSYVTLVIPWLELEEDQRQVFNGRVFESKDEQELHVRNWLAESANMPDAAANLKIVFYNARYHADLGSVFAMGDIIQELPPDELDVCVLEEPEHLNWFRAPSMESWTKRYNYVVGIVHTNYDQYATQHYSGLWTAPAIRLMSAAMVRAYCHKVIKLSAVVQDFAPEKEITSNVHGVRQEFISEGVQEATENNGETIMGEDAAEEIPEIESFTAKDSDSASQVQVYFIGKLLWTKGLDILLQYQDYYKDAVGEYFEIDIYGSGPDQLEISRAYFGRQKDANARKDRSKKRKGESKLEKASKDAFVKAFTWVNRRRGKRKRKNRNKNSKGNGNDDKQFFNATTTIYNDVLAVMESLPLKAKESIEGFPNQLKESLDQLSEDVTKAQDSVKGLPSKARRAINQLLDELSSRATTFPLPRSLYEFRRQPIPATFPGRVDHALLKGEGGNSTDASVYKIFVNPSISEVLCTTTAEALAMGKFAIIPIHPSNEFFTRFPNCLGYRNPSEFVANLRWALTHDPIPLTPELAREFTWEAATDRFLEASAITHKEARERELLGRSKIDERIAWLHNELGKGVKGDIIRKALGGGPVSGQVKYEMTKMRKGSGKATNGATMDEADETIGDDEDMDMEGEGLPRKFRNSVFVRALREAIEGSLSTGIE